MRFMERGESNADSRAVEREMGESEREGFGNVGNQTKLNSFRN